MPSDGSEWTCPPRTDQVEITLIGPGFGETVLIHVGGGSWLVVDSCVERSSGQREALRYLLGLGVEPEVAVQLILATHWHDDHIRGLDQLIVECPNATFSCSSAMRKDEFHSMLLAFNRQQVTSAGSGPSTINRVFNHLEKSNRVSRFASSARPLLTIQPEISGHGNAVRATALSPSDSAIAQSLRDIAELMPSTVTKYRAKPTNPNHFSVALWVDFGISQILLGADLEQTTNPVMGWTAVLDDDHRSRGRACIFKIPHHGSRTGFEARVHAEMLYTDPIAMLTPWTLGDKHLPTDGDIVRIVDMIPNSYITAPPKLTRSRRPLPQAVRAELKEMGVKLMNAQPRAGVIQVRNEGMRGWNEWKINLREPASHISSLAQQG